MARSVYGYELCDPDFSWLITSFLDNNPDYVLVEQDALPLVFISKKPEVFPALGYDPKSAESVTPVGEKKL